MALAGMNYLPHDKTFFGDRLLVPNQINALWWTVLPPMSVWSAPMFDVDMISVGRRDNSLSESVRALIPGFEDGATDFIKMGYMDVQGWLIAQNTPLTKDLTATPNQLIDDFIRKVPVPVLNDGDSLTPDEQLQTVAEAVGPDSNISAEGEDAIVTNPDWNNGGNFTGFATKHPAVIDQAAWYELGPQMFYEERIYLGQRHGNSVPIAEQKQRYAAAIRTKFDGKATKGRYAAIVFTVSMPHLQAGGNWYDQDGENEPISRFESWEDMIMTYQRAPLEHFEMQDEISLANARYRFRQDMQNDASQGENVGQVGLFGVTGNYDKYIAEKRTYNVLQGTWEQKPMLASMRINHTINTPFMLVPNRM